jgi:chromosome segregation ATPase
LTSDLTTTHQTLSQVQLELTSLSTENAQLANQLTQLRSTHQAKTEQDSHDVHSLTKELRELRGDLERVRMERDEWELEAGRERGKRENLEHSLRGVERQLIETAGGRDKAENGWRREEERAGRLEEVLSEFQVGKSRVPFSFISVCLSVWVQWMTDPMDPPSSILAKDLEISQATQELEGQLRYAASSLAEYKSRAADAEVSDHPLSSFSYSSFEIPDAPPLRTDWGIYKTSRVGRTSWKRS